jgi:hypothetical protein
MLLAPSSSQPRSSPKTGAVGDLSTVLSWHWELIREPQGPGCAKTWLVPGTVGADHFGLATALVKNRPQTFNEILQSCLLHPRATPNRGSVQKPSRHMGP